MSAREDAAREEWQARRNANEAREMHTRALAYVEGLNRLAALHLQPKEAETVANFLSDMLGDTFTPHLERCIEDENQSRISS